MPHSLRSPYYWSLAPNQGWQLLRHKLILLVLWGLLVLDWHLPQGVQLCQPSLPCSRSNLSHQFSSIISSMMLCDGSYWCWSWVHPRPTTLLLKSRWIGEHHSVCLSLLAHGICFTEDNMLSELVLERRLRFFFLFPI